MSENAGKIGGAGFGIGSGIGGIILLEYLNSHYKLCSSTMYGPGQYFWDPPALPPFGSTQFAYCLPGIGGNFAAILPWLLAAALGAGGLLIGMAIDASSAKTKATPPVTPDAFAP